MTFNIAGIKEQIYPEEFEAYLRLKKIFETEKFGKEHIVLFYPGCGADIINPLLFLDVLVDWRKVKTIGLIYMDVNDVAPCFISSMLNKIITSKNRLEYISDDKARIRFMFKNSRATLTYFLADVLKRPPQISFDIYFERAFEIFRAEEGWFIHYVLEHVNDGGLLISDCGFCRQDLFKKNGFVELGPEKLPSELGLYKQLKIYKKKKKIN